ncbi:MAG: hypothetical protein RLZZ61_1226 [Pseudomonadota bacterium]|jgi:hypothetical protein
MIIEHLPLNRIAYRYSSSRPWLILVLCLVASILLSFASRLVSNFADVAISPFNSEMMKRSADDLPNSSGAVATNCRFEKTTSIICKAELAKSGGRLERIAAGKIANKPDLNAHTLG